jgi:phosphoglycerate dehydrogenase-like enzyme
MATHHINPGLSRPVANDGETPRGTHPSRVGLIGVGLMGSALAERLTAHGLNVVGYDIDPDRCREE